MGSQRIRIQLRKILRENLAGNAAGHAVGNLVEKVLIVCNKSENGKKSPT